MYFNKISLAARIMRPPGDLTITGIAIPILPKN